MRLPKTFAAMVALALVASIAQADSIKLPSEIKGEVGAFVAVRAETEGKTVRFVPLTPGLSVFPADLLADKKTTVVVAARPGRYSLLAYTAINGEPSEPCITVVIVGSPEPVPPPPPPGPGPGPGPGPAPPEPDALTKRIREALAADPGTAAEKVKHALALSGFYDAMAKHVLSDQAATVGDLLGDYRAAIPAVLPADAIPATRKMCGVEVASVCGDDIEAKIDGPMKTKLIDLFGRLSAALAVEAKRGGR